MNVQVKQNVYCLRVYNVLADHIGLSGHYTLVLDRREGRDELFVTKHGDYGNLVSYIPETNPLQRATPEQQEFFLTPKRTLNRINDTWSPPLDLEDTFDSLRHIYRDHEALIDLVLQGNIPTATA